MSFLGSIWAKIAAGAALLLALFGAKAVYDRNRRREGARDVTDQLNKEGAQREDAMHNAPKVETDDDLDETLREGRG